MENTWLSEAVSNNAAWCAAVADSHRIPSGWSDSIWSSEHPMPPLYPNIVTLHSDVEIYDQIGDIDPQLPTGWGIKDSFKELQLDDKGFAVAFEAFWYCRAPRELKPNEIGANTRVENVSSQSELERWENAWGEKPGIFKSLLLADDDVELVYVEKDGRFVSGLVANQSGKVVGISNAFGQPEGILACIDSVGDKHPTKGIVGYGGKAELAALSKVGFREIGELQIWLRD
jgi:hypothetical protein